VIDLDGGLVLVGPESEWFWTAFSGILVAFSLFAVFRQLRLQTGQKMRDDIASLEAEYSERFCATASSSPEHGVTTWHRSRCPTRPAGPSSASGTRSGSSPGHDT
jgi:hypothetical protein